MEADGGRSKSERDDGRGTEPKSGAEAHALQNAGAFAGPLGLTTGFVKRSVRAKPALRYLRLLL